MIIVYGNFVVKCLITLKKNTSILYNRFNTGFEKNENTLDYSKIESTKKNDDTDKKKKNSTNKKMKKTLHIIVQIEKHEPIQNI